jgi:hypothetical protein
VQAGRQPERDRVAARVGPPAPIEHAPPDFGRALEGTPQHLAQQAREGRAALGAGVGLGGEGLADGGFGRGHRAQFSVAKRAEQMRRDAETGSQRDAARRGLRLAAVEAARAKLLAEHKDELESEATSALIAELDLEEQQIRVAMGEH